MAINVTPSGSGVSSNMRPSSSQALQQASQQVAQGGAQSAGSVDNLTATLAGINQKIAVLFQKQQRDFATQNQQMMKAVAGSVEKMGNQIGTAFERGAERRANLQGQKELSDHDFNNQRKAEAERRQIERDDEAARAAEEASIKRDEMEMLGNFRKAEQARSDYLDGLEVLSKTVYDENLDLDTQTRGVLRAVMSDMQSNINAHLVEQPNALRDVAAAHVAQRRSSFAQARADGASPADVAVPNAQIDNSLRFSPDTLDKLGEYMTSRGEGRGVMPDTTTFTSTGGLRDLVMAMRDDAIERKFSQGQTRREVGKEMNRTLVDAQKALTETATLMDGYGKWIEGVSEVSFRQAIAKLSAFPEERMETRDVNGSPTKVIPARELYYALADEILAPLDVNHDANLRQMFRDYTDGKVKLDQGPMIQFGMLFNKVSKAIGSGVDGALSDNGERKLLRGTGWAYTTQERDVAFKEIQKLKNLADDADSLFLKQPAVKAFHEEVATVGSLIGRHAKRLTGEKAGQFDYAFSPASPDSIGDTSMDEVSSSHNKARDYLKYVSETDPLLEQAMRKALLTGEIHDTARPIAELGRADRERREREAKAQQPTAPLDPARVGDIAPMMSVNDTLGPQQSGQMLNQGIDSLMGRKPQPPQQNVPPIIGQGGY